MVIFVPILRPGLQLIPGEAERFRTRSLGTAGASRRREGI